MASLADLLARETRDGDLYETLPDGRLRCYACGHCCPLPDGAIGVCKVRFNKDGRLRVPWGYVGGVQCDPIEKKPFFHAHPGALAYSFGMLGCDLHCAYCQNWVTSQALRDPAAVAPPLEARPSSSSKTRSVLVRAAVVSTYNEPLITSEWAVAVFKEAKAAGLTTGFVSNGNGTPPRPRISSPVGRPLQGRPQELRRPALSSAGRPDRSHSRYDSQAAHDGFLARNRDPAHPGLQRFSRRDHAAHIVRGQRRSYIPWHVTAFHGDYKMNEPENTTADMLMGAAEIGKESGLQLCLCGKPAGFGWRSRGHALRDMRRDADFALRLSHPELPHHGHGIVSVVRDRRAGSIRHAVQWTNRVFAVRPRLALTPVGPLLGPSCPSCSCPPDPASCSPRDRYNCVVP